MMKNAVWTFGLWLALQGGFLLGQTIATAQGCIFDCRGGSIINGVYQLRCRLVCPQPTIVILGDSTVPDDPLPCYDAMVTLERFTMTPGDTNSNISQIAPTLGRWGNDFRFEGRALWVNNNNFKIILKISDNVSTRRTVTIRDAEFTYTHRTYSTYYDRDGAFSYNFALEIVCGGETLNTPGPSGSVNMKRADVWYYEKTLSNTDLLNQVQIARKEDCSQRTIVFTDAYEETWSFLGGVSNLILANFGVSARIQHSIQHAFVLPPDRHASLIREEKQNVYDARRYTVDWLGQKDQDEYYGQLLNTFRDYRMVDLGPCSGN